MDDIEVYDTVLADTLEDGDQVGILNEEGVVDYLENIRVVKDKDSVLVTGLSNVTGDKSTYILPWDREVDLWAV